MVDPVCVQSRTLADGFLIGVVVRGGMISPTVCAFGQMRALSLRPDKPLSLQRPVRNNIQASLLAIFAVARVELSRARFHELLLFSRRINKASTIRYFSSRGTVNATSLSSGNVLQATKAVRLLPSTKG